MINCLSLELKSNHEFVFGPFSVSFWHQEELFFFLFCFFNPKHVSAHLQISVWE